MTTMAAKLKGTGAEITRNLGREVKTIKAIKAGMDARDPQRDMLERLYLIIDDVLGLYNATEINILLKACVNEADKRRKDMQRRQKALGKAAAKMTNKELDSRLLTAGMTKKEHAGMTKKEKEKNNDNSDSNENT